MRLNLLSFSSWTFFVYKSGNASWYAGLHAAVMSFRLTLHNMTKSLSTPPNFALHPQSSPASLVMSCVSIRPQHAPITERLILQDPCRSEDLLDAIHQSLWELLAAFDANTAQERG